MDRVSFGNSSTLDDSVTMRIDSTTQLPSYVLPLAIIGGVVGVGILLYYATKKSK